MLSVPLFCFRLYQSPLVFHVAVGFSLLFNFHLKVSVPLFSRSPRFQFPCFVFT